MNKKYTGLETELLYDKVRIIETPKWVLANLSETSAQAATQNPLTGKVVVLLIKSEYARVSF